MLELSGGNTLTIAETVSIKTEGPNAYGIRAQGGDNTIDVSGDINTMDAGAHGIFARNGTNTIDVSGDINTMDAGAYGIFALGTGSNTIDVSGDINTAGDNAHGIAANGGSNSIDVSSDINTAGFNAHGIWAQGGDNTIDVSGDINTKGQLAYGIFAQNGSNSIDVSGNIQTEGRDAYGIQADGGDNTIDVEGDINTKGHSAYGILAQNGTNMIDVSGNINTENLNAYGIWAQGGSNSIDVSGEINTAGDDAHGISAHGGDNTIILSGAISATGAIGANAVEFINGGNNRLELRPGFQITGNVVSQDADDTLTLGGEGIASFDVGTIGTGAQFRGFDHFETRGAATWTLTGDSPETDWNIAAGTLIVNGTLGEINVASGGILGGSGTVGATTVKDGATIAPGNSIGSLSITGDATFNAGSTYRVYVDQTGASRLEVGGDAIIDGGSVEAVSLESDGNQSVLGTYTILEVDGQRTGTFDDVSANYAFIDPSLSYDDTRVLLTLALREVPNPGTGTTPNPEMTQLQALARPFAGNANQQGLVAILDSLDQTDPRYQNFVEAFRKLSEDEVTAVLEELSGSRLAWTSGVSLQFATALIDFVQMANGFGGTGGRFGDGAQTASILTPGTVQFASAGPLARGDYEVGQGPAPAGAGRTDGPASWVRIVGQTGRQGSANGMPGSDSRSAGLHAGIDMPVNDAFSVGAAVGYEQGRVTSGGMLGVDTESYSGAVYGRYQLDDLRLSGAFSYSRIEYDSSRTVPNFGQQTAEYGADAWNIDAHAAYDFRPGPDGLTVSPLVGIRYIGMRQEGYEETGTAGLSVGSLTSDSVRARLGAETRFESARDDGMTVALTARAAWSREIGSPETALRASLLGSDSFAIEGQGLPRDIAELGVTLDLGITDNVDLVAAYNGSLGGNYTDHRGQAGLRYVW